MKPEIAVTDDLDVCLALRRRVFVEEQGVPEADEIDGHDAEATHLLVRLDGEPVGTARVLIRGDVSKIGRVCVLPGLRGLGIGQALMTAALDWLRDQPGLREARLGAQTQAQDFYAALGFHADGAVYLDAGIAHRDMCRRL